MPLAPSSRVNRHFVLSLAVVASLGICGASASAAGYSGGLLALKMADGRSYAEQLAERRHAAATYSVIVTAHAIPYNDDYLGGRFSHTPSNYNATAGSEVPEPASFVVLLLASGVGLANHRSRRPTH